MKNIDTGTWHLLKPTGKEIEEIFGSIICKVVDYRLTAGARFYVRLTSRTTLINGIEQMWHRGYHVAGITVYGFGMKDHWAQPMGDQPEIELMFEWNTQ